MNPIDVAVRFLGYVLRQVVNLRATLMVVSELQSSLPFLLIIFTLIGYCSMH